jgi:hypothetical protein
MVVPGLAERLGARITPRSGRERMVWGVAVPVKQSAKVRLELADPGR